MRMVEEKYSFFRKVFFIIAGTILSFLIIVFIITFLTIGGLSLFRDRVAVVEISGIISSSREILRELERYGSDPYVKAIVLRIESPGGGVAASQEIYNAILKLKEKNKKIVTSMGAVAASGGYYIACASDRIVANPGTITGSIGVIAQFINIEELLNKLGMKGYVIKSGRYKDIGSPFREMTEDERSLVQDVINDIHSQFVNAVSESRKIDYEKVAEIADGRYFSGRKAKEIGLVDELGDLNDAIKIASSLAGIKGEPYVIYPSRKFSILDLFFRKSSLSDYLKNLGIIGLINVYYLSQPFNMH